MSVFFGGFFKFLALFSKSKFIGLCMSHFKYLAFFFKSIEIYSSHYSSVSTVPFLRIVRLKDCAQENTVLYCTREKMSARQATFKELLPQDK
jgi:hypothetical protein